MKDLPVGRERGRVGEKGESEREKGESGGERRGRGGERRGRGREKGERGRECRGREGGKKSVFVHKRYIHLYIVQCRYKLYLH